LRHGCPAGILLEWLHGIDSIRFRGFRDSSGHEGSNAVRHQNSVFHDLLKLIDWPTFDRLVFQHGNDELARNFTSRHHLRALVFSQLEGSHSLRAVEATMKSHRIRLYHVGAKVPPRSTLADANKTRSFKPFAGLFEHMLAKANRAIRRRIDGEVRLIDSTSLHLAGAGAHWARFSADFCGLKVHVVYDPDAGRPVYHAMTPANVNDITPAQAMPIEAGATYVFDLGYYDYAWWAQLDEAGCRIVTRFKTNTPLNKARNLIVPPDSDVLSDRIGFLPARQAKNRKNPMRNAVREITVMTETGKMLRILTNDLDAPGQEIADLYKRRWQIELFFRLIKQTLRITHFMGRSQNAVRIQVAVALIAYLILHTLRQMTKVKHGFLELVRLVRTNLMHRKSSINLLEIQPPPQKDSKQLDLNWGTS
jgi:transposase